MHGRPLRRATALALLALLVFAGTVMADQLLADGDVANSGIQGTKPLGNVAAGAEVPVQVEFTLTCVGLGHVDIGQTVTLAWSGLGSKPPGGEIVSVTPASIGPIAAPWGVDGQGCPTNPVPSVIGATRSIVTLRAPTTPGAYLYTVIYDRSLSLPNPSDANAFTRTATQVSFTMTVVGNAAPTLTVPSSFTVEGNTTGGWTADWSGVSATDPEDNPDPTPSCDPPAGDVLPLGTTDVTCSVTDSAGASATGRFTVTVVDRTDPVLADMPPDRTMTTGNPGGVAVTYTSPTATDIVDASPAVDCSPASGATFPVGRTTTVTCTAIDRSGNRTSATFTVSVEYVGAHSASAIWLEPVGNGQDAFEANHGRTIPVKVRLFVDGVERSSGQALLTLTPCGAGTAALALPLEWGGGRWNAALDTSTLRENCYIVAASIDGLVAGSFRLELRGEAATARLKTNVAASPPPKKTGHFKPR